MKTNRRSFLRGLLASVAAMPVAAQAKQRLAGAENLDWWRDVPIADPGEGARFGGACRGYAVSAVPVAPGHDLDYLVSVEANIPGGQGTASVFQGVTVGGNDPAYALGLAETKLCRRIRVECKKLLETEVRYRGMAW